MPPYANQNFYNPNPYMNNFGQPSMQNQYMDRLNQLQQYHQGLQQPVQQPAMHPQGIIGRAVNDFSEIKADDVPMNGTPAIFIKNDLSEIEVRVWGKDGLIRPTSYKPILDQNQPEQSNILQMDFNALNDDVRALREDILERLDSIEKSMGATTTKATSRAKKGADEE